MIQPTDGQIDELLRSLDGIASKTPGRYSLPIGDLPEDDDPPDPANPLAAMRGAVRAWVGGVSGELDSPDPPSLTDRLHDIFDDPAAWLATPHPQFGGRRPGDLIGTDEEGKVVDLLIAVDHGMF